MKSNIYIVTEGHPRLKSIGFEDQVKGFLKNRLVHFLGEDNVRFCSDNDDKLLSLENKIIVQASLLNPFLDEELLVRMIDKAQRTNKIMCADGAIPGTAPLKVYSSHVNIGKNEVAYVHSDMQRKWNTQLNLVRLKRVKLFQSILRKWSDAYQWTMAELMAFCASPEGVRFLLSYDSDVEMQDLAICPLCKSSDRHALHADNGHPVSGFLNRESVYYYQCEECSLVYLSPCMKENDLWRYYDSFSYENILNIESLDNHYDNLSPETSSTFNNYAAIAPQMRELPHDATLIDLGGGIGEFAVYTRERFPQFNITLCDFRIDERVQEKLRKRDIQARALNFLDESFGDSCFDLITNWEVVEHLPLERLESYFSKIYRALNVGGFYCLSTPDFDNDYTRALDFWSAYPGEHLSVLSRKVLEPILNRCGFTVKAEYHECVTLKICDRWFLYGAQSGASMAGRAESKIVNNFLKNSKCREAYQGWMRENNLGSELILCLQK